ncbi:hypothetical protein ACS0TY_005033 [Phlomoides rotata]
MRMELIRYVFLFTIGLLILIKALTTLHDLCTPVRSIVCFIMNMHIDGKLCG